MESLATHLEEFNGEKPEDVISYKLAEGLKTSLILILSFMLRKSTETSDDRVQKLQLKWKDILKTKLKNTLPADEVSMENFDVIHHDGKIKAQCFKCDQAIVIQTGDALLLNGHRFLSHVWAHFFSKEMIEKLKAKIDNPDNEADAANSPDISLHSELLPLPSKLTLDVS